MGVDVAAVSFESAVRLMEAYSPSGTDRKQDAFHEAGILAGRLGMNLMQLGTDELRQLASLALACEVKFQRTFEGTRGAPTDGQFGSDFMFLLKETCKALTELERTSPTDLVGATIGGNQG